MYDRNKLKDLPQTPGVYLMKNENKEIIYVGKAINLRNRVRQYFQARHNANSKTAVLVSHIAEIETIVTDSEMEALILESNLIKQHRPRYNILLKDDKNYPWIKVTLNEEYPKIVMTRSYKKDGSRYFGPFTSAAAVKNTIEAVSKIYPLKTCNRLIQYGKKSGRPCLNYHIGQCQGPCQGKLPPAKYKENINAILEILNGHYSSLLDSLQEKMKKAALSQDYENAARYRDQIEGIRHIAQKQKITTANQQDQDFINLALDGDQACFQVFHVREGKLLGRDPFFLSGIGDEGQAEIIASFLKQYYLNCGFIPKEIVISTEPESQQTLEAWLEELAGRKIAITVPQRGHKVKMLQMVQENAEIALNLHFLEIAQRENRKLDRLQELAEFLKLPQLPDRIEAYDISNIAGTSNVGGMVVFSDGKLDKKACRRFKIKSVEGQNDYASMQEMLFRRMERAQKEGDSNGFWLLPEVMMMDGGQGHVNAAKAIISMYPFDIKVCGLVKDDKHRLRGVFYEGKELPVKKASSLGVFLNEISEEVHKYAIGYHKILRKKEMLASVLEDIPGVGEKRRKALMFHFGRLENIKKATVAELAAVSGMSQKLAQTVYDFFHAEV